MSLGQTFERYKAEIRRPKTLHPEPHTRNPETPKPETPKPETPSPSPEPECATTPVA